MQPKEKISPLGEENRPYVVYFAKAHQSRIKKIIDADPVLVLASDSLEALKIARRVGGMKKKKFLEIRELDRKEFKEKAEELLENGRILPEEILSSLGLASNPNKISAKGT